jgi:hypothetical protein
MPDAPVEGLKGPTCIWCAMDRGYEAAKSKLEVHPGTCVNCGQRAAVTKASDWKRKFHADRDRK